VRANQKGWGAILSGKRCDEIYELDFPTRGRVRKSLSRYLPAEHLQLFGEIHPAFFDRLGAGRTWTQIDHRLNVRERFFAGEFLPDFRLSVAGRRRLRPIARSQKTEREKQPRTA
jgi:hypothetical protein